MKFESRDYLSTDGVVFNITDENATLFTENHKRKLNCDVLFLYIKQTTDMI